MKARDEIKDAHIHVLTYAYTEYTLLVEKSIRAIPDANIKDNSSQLFLFQSMKDRIDSRIEIIESHGELHYSENCVQSRGKLLKNKFMATPRTRNGIVTLSLL